MIFVNNLFRERTLIDSRVHCRLESELHVLRQVVLEVKITIPREVLGVCQVHLRRRVGIEVTQFHVRERAVHIRVEAP